MTLKCLFLKKWDNDVGDHIEKFEKQKIINIKNLKTNK